MVTDVATQVNDEQSKAIARQFLEYVGYTANDVPTAEGQRSADLHATCPNNEKPPLLVEAKEKEPDKELCRLRDEKLRAGEMHELFAELGEQPVLNRIMDDAIGQLRETQDRYPDALRFVFVVCTGFNAEHRFEQFRHRAVGIATVVDFGENGSLQECYFFRDSDFFKYRNILDGVIFAQMHGDGQGFEASLYPNCYANRYESLRDCEALKAVLCDGFVDVASRSVEGLVWSLHDVAGNRSNEQEMLAAVRTKYNLSERVMTMQMKHAGVEMLVPRK